MTTVYDFEAKSIDGQLVPLKQWQGKVLVIVNVASQCGFTPQYQGLQQLYKSYNAEGLTVLGFPCNQFRSQEPGTDKDIADFCDLKFKVTFPMFSKVEVNGQGTHPLFAFLKKKAPGVLGTEMIKWNFTKFLVDRSGNVVKRYAPTDTPESMAQDIVALLK